MLHNLVSNSKVRLTSFKKSLNEPSQRYYNGRARVPRCSKRTFVNVSSQNKLAIGKMPSGNAMGIQTIIQLATLNGCEDGRAVGAP
jgi:hypothetical protein